MEFEKRNQQTLRSLLKAAGSFKTGTSKAGAKVTVINGTAYATSDFAYNILNVEDNSWVASVDELQVFEFFLPEKNAWIPVICKAGGALQGQKEHTNISALL